MSMENNINRKKEVIAVCLQMLITKGLTGTTTRDLSNALKLQSGGLYYYFKSKDEVVIACAEEAAIRLESNLIFPAFKDIADPDRMFERLEKRADEMAPTMKFLVQVCSTQRYRAQMEPALTRLCERYHYYAEKAAETLQCELEEIEPYVYMCITAISNYMIFGEHSYIVPQMNLIKKELKELQKDIVA